MFPNVHRNWAMANAEGASAKKKGITPTPPARSVYIVRDPVIGRWNKDVSWSTERSKRFC